MLLHKEKIEELKTLSDDPSDNFFKSLIEIFEQRSPSILKEIEQSLVEQDFFQIEKKAHALKGSSSNIGAEKVSQICGEIEELARKQKIDLIKMQLILLNSFLANTIIELKNNI